MFRRKVIFPDLDFHKFHKTNRQALFPGVEDEKNFSPQLMISFLFFADFFPQKALLRERWSRNLFPFVLFTILRVFRREKMKLNKLAKLS